LNLELYKNAVQAVKSQVRL